MSNKTVLKRAMAEKVALDYQPKKFPYAMPEAASSFMQMNPSHGAPGTFRMNSLIAEQTGIADVERLSGEEVIEAKVLEKLKQVEEGAYREAYSLGLDEGRAEAIKKHEAELNEHVARLNEIIQGLTTLKLDLLNFNEAHIVKLAYYLASRIAMSEIAEDPEAILPVLKTVIEGSRDEEQITIRLSSQDFQFLNETRDRLGKEFDVLKNARLEEAPEIRPGGCVLETNYGVVDATLEERTNKLMDSLFSTAPKVRDSIAS